MGARNYCWRGRGKTNYFEGANDDVKMDDDLVDNENNIFYLFI